MALAEIRKPEFSRRITVEVSGDRVTVADVLAFADKLREAEADPRQFVSDHHTHNTRHFCGMTVAWDETLSEVTA